MKKLISAVTASLILISLFPAVSASPSSSGAEYAAYLNSNFDGSNSAVVVGDIYSADGDVVLHNADEGHKITGDIYYNSSNNYTNDSTFIIDGNAIPLDDTAFNAPVIDAPGIPVIDNYVAQFSAGWYPLPAPVTRDTHYGNLTVTNKLTVDVTNGDISIVVDNLTMTGMGTIELIGDGKLYLYVNSDLSISESCVLNPNHDNNKFFVFVTNGDLLLDGNGRIFANIYLFNESSEAEFTHSGMLFGDLVFPGKDFCITGSSNIHGNVYAPNADAEIYGSGILYGRIVANSLKMYGFGKVLYDPEHTDIPLPDILEKYTLTVNVSPAGAGSVTPASGEYNHGSIVNISASPNSGYVFDRFETDSILPNASGDIEMTQNVTLTAIFRVADTYPDDIPEGDPITLSCSYAYLYGYGDGSGNVGPSDDVTNEQLSAMIHRLLRLNGHAEFSLPLTPTFLDLEPGCWSYRAMEYMTSIGVFKSANDYVYPTSGVTRGEAARLISIALNIAPDSDNPNSLVQFTDIDATNPYYFFIKALHDSGTLLGSGSAINPESVLTRAEVVTIINRLIGRDDRYDISDIPNPYNDIDDAKWYYSDIIRASFGFSDEPDSETGLFELDPENKLPLSEIDY